jgi:dGTPase
VYCLVTDIIRNSLEKPTVAFSAEVSHALRQLKQFNLEKIYLNPRIKPESGKIKQLFQLLFERYLNDLERDNQDSIIFAKYLNEMSDDYRNNASHSEITRDFIAGMTDDFFLNQFAEDLRPKRTIRHF